MLVEPLTLTALESRSADQVDADAITERGWFILGDDRDPLLSQGNERRKTVNSI